MSPTPQIPPLDLERYTYVLPDDRIAAHPLPERDASRLLVYRSGAIEHAVFRDVPSFLPRASLLVVNTTRVIAARLHMAKPTGGIVEVLLTDPLRPFRDPVATLSSSDRSVWRCLIGGRNVQPGMILTSPTSSLTATVIDRAGTEGTIELAWATERSLSEMIADEGSIPLPPYLGREAEADDEERYQTVYAVEEGSVAAPTAGLHFTERVFDDLAARGVERTNVTLHVGLGTFHPVLARDARDHVMHGERYGVTRAALETMLRHADSDEPWTTAVGTTSLRTLESLFAVGARAVRDGAYGEVDLDVAQWEAFDRSLDGHTRADVLRGLLAVCDARSVHTLWGETNLMLAPGCRIAMADALITNFHQPGNTLLLLVAAFVGDGWKAIYDEALRNDYRFLSYGDSSLLVRATT
jgi:S-adenosylmethionine:tRNA ribosyltransferase-isomerase